MPTPPLVLASKPAVFTQPVETSTPAANAGRSRPVPTISVVVPALNEAKNLPHVLPLIPDWIHEVLLVAGHSTDSTVEVARALRPDIRVVEQKGRGKGAALRSGFAAATGQIIVMLDADGSMDPREIPAYVAALVSGADFAKGSRFLPGGGTVDMELHRKLGNWGLMLAVRLLFGGKYTDLCYGYNAFWAHILPTLGLQADGFEIETQMNVRVLLHRLAVAEVPSFEAKRVHGVSNLRTFHDGWRVLKTILRERFAGGRSHAQQDGWRPPNQVDVNLTLITSPFLRTPQVLKDSDSAARDWVA